MIEKERARDVWHIGSFHVPTLFIQIGAKQKASLNTCSRREHVQRKVHV